MKIINHIYDKFHKTTYQGTPSDESMEAWLSNEEYRTSFDHEKVIPDFKYKIEKQDMKRNNVITMTS